MWDHVVRHFEDFLNEIELSFPERFDAEGKAERVAKSLFAKYYPFYTFDSRYYKIVGSYAKGTAARPRTDIDMIFILPSAVFTRINVLTGNKQSQLLQEVKNGLLVTFPNTDIRGDGPVVKVPFGTYNFEVVPVFVGQNPSQLITAHTKFSGSWKCTSPDAELQVLRSVDGRSSGKATHLTKMLKVWKRECNVEIKSICLEVGATVFIDNWINRDKPIVYYDWMVRDFFAFLLQYVNGRARPAGIGNEWIPLGGAWQSKCQSAYDRASKACQYEKDNNAFEASLEWRKVFGNQFKTDYRSLLSRPA